MNEGVLCVFKLEVIAAGAYVALVIPVSFGGAVLNKGKGTSRTSSM
jgi:hypothetical protein